MTICSTRTSPPSGPSSNCNRRCWPQRAASPSLSSEVATLGNIDYLVQSIEELYILAKLTEKHRDIVDTEALAYVAAPTEPLLQVYRSCQLEIRSESCHLDRQERRRHWAQSLPSGNTLKELIEAAGNGGRWECLTFWREGDEDYWSVTNAYGIDDVASVSTRAALAQAEQRSVHRAPRISRETAYARGSVSPYQVVRGAFMQGDPQGDEHSGFSRHGHIQLAVRDPRAIVGWFIPDPDRLMAPEEYQTAGEALANAPTSQRRRAGTPGP